MSKCIPANIVIEDDLSEHVLIKILSVVGDYYLAPGYQKNGAGYIDKNINGFNNGAKGTPFIVLRDLDNWPCAPQLISNLLTNRKNKYFIFRIVVKEIETWLLADKNNLANYLSVNSAIIPDNPETICDPKEFIVNIAEAPVIEPSLMI